MNFSFVDEKRDEVARILEQVAAEGLEHPRNLDAAIDAIASQVDGASIQQVIDADGDIYYIDSVEDASVAFGPNVTVEKGVFVRTGE